MQWVPKLLNIEQKFTLDNIWIAVGGTGTPLLRSRFITVRLPDVWTTEISPRKSMIHHGRWSREVRCPRNSSLTASKAFGKVDKMRNQSGEVSRKTVFFSNVKKNVSEHLSRSFFEPPTYYLHWQINIYIYFLCDTKNKNNFFLHFIVKSEWFDVVLLFSCAHISVTFLLDDLSFNS